MTSKAGASIAEGWVHTCAEIPAKGLEVEREASAEELKAAASYLDIPAVEKLRVRYTIRAAPRGRYVLDGQILARVVQSCVVTLDPVVTVIEEGIASEFRPAEDQPAETGSEMEVHEAVEYEPIENHHLAAGRVIMETLLAALPAFPRSEGAALELKEAGPADGGKVNPFAALSQWKPKSG